MMPRSVFVGPALCLLIGVTGCTTMSSSSDRALSRTESGSREGTLLDRLTDEPDEVETPEEEQLTSFHSRESAAALPSHSTSARPMDSTMRLLIETELRDLPEDQRQEWMDYLTTIDPSSIPHVLKSRRLQAEQTASAADRESGPSHTSTYGESDAYARSSEGFPRTSVAANGSMTSTNSAPERFASSHFGTEHSNQRPDSRLGLDRDHRLQAPDPTGRESTRNGISPFNARPRNEAQLAYGESPRSSGPAGHSARSLSYELPMINPSESPVTEVPRGGGTGRIEYDLPPAEGPMQAVSTPNTPVATGAQGTYWQEELARLTALIEAEVGAKQPGMSDQERLAYVKHHVWLRMLHLMAEQPHLAQQAIPGIDPSEQEFWTELFWAVSNYFDAHNIPNSADRAALTVAQIDSARRKLQDRAPLELRNASFCYKINSFGNYDRYERDEFRPGQPVLLYTEVRNFRSEPTNAGAYTTRLRSRIEIRSGGPDGEVVDENTFPATEDLCRSVRNDYFHSYKIDLPQHLSPGPHTLVLIVEDELSGKIASESIALLIRR